MKIVVFSDSHERLSAMYEAIEREQPDAIIHLGDCVDDAQTLCHSYPHIAIWYVRGNNDYQMQVPLSQVVALEGVHMYLTHGHKEYVSFGSLGSLHKCARQAGCRVALYGHTHRLHEQIIDGIYILNPGSISLPRGGQASYLRMIVEQGDIKKLEKCNTDGVCIA